MRPCTLAAAITGVAAGIVSAQTSGTSGNATRPTVHVVDVGLTYNQFTPIVTNASVGDIVSFTFHPANHSVIRSEFGFPCIPYEDDSTQNIGKGFFSGFMPTSFGDTPPTYNITINDTSPLFYYCSAPGSCIQSGMVGVINPNASTPIAKQVSLALEAQYMLQPGEDYPAEAASSASALAATATDFVTSTATATTTATATATPAHKHNDDKGSTLRGGAIAGIVIGGVAVLLLAVGLFYYIGRRSRRSHAAAAAAAPQYPSQGSQPPYSSGGPPMQQDPYGQGYAYGAGVLGYHPQHNSLPPYASYEQRKLSEMGVHVESDAASLRSASPNTPFLGTAGVSPPLPQQNWAAFMHEQHIKEMDPRLTETSELGGDARVLHELDAHHGGPMI